MQHQNVGNARLVDHLLSSQQLKNDAALSRALDVVPAIISKVRSGRMNVSSTIILNIHETFDIPVKTIRSLIAQ